MKIIYTLVGITAILCTSFCPALSQRKSRQPADTLVNFKVKPAPEWTNLFYRKQGWFGADGIFSMTLRGKETIGAGAKDSVLMYFSDTMTGSLIGDSAVSNFKMINNSFAWITGANP